MGYGHRCERCGWPQFSPRQREILDLICEGLTNREIGKRLFLTEKTVKNYTSQLFKLTDTTSRVQFVIGAFRHGYVPLPEQHEPMGKRLHVTFSKFSRLSNKAIQ